MAASVANRVCRVDRAAATRRLQATAHHLAATVGVAPAELLFEARDLARTAREAGVPPAAMVARELGMTEGAVRVEVARLGGDVDGDRW